MLIAHLALEAPEHFGGDDVDALFGADIALAKWEDPERRTRRFSRRASCAPADSTKPNGEPPTRD